MRNKIPELRLALNGRLREYHRFLLQCLLDQLQFIESHMAHLTREIDGRMTPFQEIVARWTTIPGIDEITAWNLVAEIGVDMEQFPSAAHLACWAGVCPGSNQSAGKQRSGKMRRCGRKRAIMAVAHNLLIVGYHMLKHGRDYYELGADYFDRLNAEGFKRYLIKRLARIGYKATLEPLAV